MKKLQLQGVILLITAMLSAVLLSACGKNPEDKELIPKPGTKQEADAEMETKTEANAEAEAETEAETTAETTADVSQDENWDDFCGDWILVGFEYSDSVDDIEPSVDNPYYYAEHEWTYSEILIYDEENSLYADYRRTGYETESMNGMALVKQDPTSDGRPVAQLRNRRDEKEMVRTLTLIGENELRYCEQELWREMGLEHVMICTYLREGSKEMEQKKEYQYVNEVTVSTVQELAEAIQNRTKIILKEGTYNFSDLNCDSIKNPNIENKSLIKSIDIVGIWIYDEIQIERRRWTA